VIFNHCSNIEADVEWTWVTLNPSLDNIKCDVEWPEIMLNLIEPIEHDVEWSYITLNIMFNVISGHSTSCSMSDSMLPQFIQHLFQCYCISWTSDSMVTWNIELDVQLPWVTSNVMFNHCSNIEANVEWIWVTLNMSLGNNWMWCFEWPYIKHWT
jgi:hypothetical protein